VPQLGSAWENHPDKAWTENEKAANAAPDAVRMQPAKWRKTPDIEGIIEEIIEGTQRRLIFLAM